ncbi:MAG: Prolyl oligopeptidase family protein [Myxococcaceae bacterium]|nr:Prolyl oligopeptidase family protein [Myxococcaceae bacterium]
MLLPILLALAAAPAAAPAKARPYTVQDQVNLRRLLGFTVSPDGNHVVLTVRATDYEANKGKIDLWHVRKDGTDLRPLTSHPAPDTDPLFAPDGKSVYFLSARGETSQVFNLPLEGGEPAAVTRAPVDVSAFLLSADGKTIAFAADVFPDCKEADTLACTEKRLAEQAKSKATGKIYEQLMFRHWDTWKDGRRSHLFVQAVAGGPAKDLMPKLAADAPVKPFGGSEQFAFSADGKQLVFTARDVGREEAWSTDLDLFSVPTDGSAAPKKLTTTNRATDTNPAFSPDGKTLAYLAMARAGYEADKLTIVLRSWPDGKERRLTDGWDRSPDSLQWSADGKTLYVNAWDVGQLSLFAIDVASGKVSTVVGPGHVSSLSVAGADLFFAQDSLNGPSDLYLLEGGKPKQLTKLNEAAMKNVKLGSAEQFSFPGWNGDKVYGYVVKPADFDPKKKYPIAFLIHGGPQGSFGNAWHYRWNPQSYAGRGYVAVSVDFHGSIGYGQAFTDAIRSDWGGKPLEDLQKGFAAALEKYPFLDKSRACALGASYGGFMINWMAGMWNEPWKCFITHDGNLDETFAYYATEELWFPEWEHGGTPRDQHMGFAKHNPIDHVAKWKVPTLVVHGGKDYRVVDIEGLATFTALQRRGIPSKLLYFPDENHWVLKPQNSVLWHDTVLGWMDQWTAKK